MDKNLHPRDRAGKFAEKPRKDSGQLDILGESIEYSAEGNFTGPKYTGPLRGTEVAKRIREDLREAKQAGVLPEGMRLHVKAKGQEITVTVAEADWERWYALAKDDNGKVVWLPTPEWEELNETIRRISDNHNQQTSAGDRWFANHRTTVVAESVVEQRRRVYHKLLVTDRVAADAYERETTDRGYGVMHWQSWRNDEWFRRYGERP